MTKEQTIQQLLEKIEKEEVKANRCYFDNERYFDAHDDCGTFDNLTWFSYEASGVAYGYKPVEDMTKWIEPYLLICSRHGYDIPSRLGGGYTPGAHIHTHLRMIQIYLKQLTDAIK